jgi:hypothetical protein
VCKSVYYGGNFLCPMKDLYDYPDRSVAPWIDNRAPSSDERQAMTLNGHSIALWAGIGASMIGMIGGYQSIHKDLETAHQDAINAARTQQQRRDEFEQWRFNVERHLEFIDNTLPRDRQAIARQVFALRQQVQEVKASQPVMYERSAPVLAMRKMKSLDVPAVSANTPAIPKTEAPQ